jgi:hypothetical protein
MRSLMYLDRRRFGKPPLSLWGVCTMTSCRGAARQRAGNYRRLKKFPECGFRAADESRPAALRATNLATNFD